MVETGHFPSWPLIEDLQAVYLVKPNALHRTGLSIGEDNGLADEFSLGLIELAKDSGCTYFRGGHEWPSPKIMV